MNDWRWAAALIVATVTVELAWLVVTFDPRDTGADEMYTVYGLFMIVWVPLPVLGIVGIASAIGLTFGWRGADYVGLFWAVIGGLGAGLMTVTFASDASYGRSIGCSYACTQLATLPLIAAGAAVASGAVVYLLIRARRGGRRMLDETARGRKP